ncbi:MAG: hypothetical protein ACRD45_02175 [Bryobacteraceae bacterium]
MSVTDVVVIDGNIHAVDVEGDLVALSASPNEGASREAMSARPAYMFAAALVEFNAAISPPALGSRPARSKRQRSGEADEESDVCEEKSAPPSSLPVPKTANGMTLSSGKKNEPVTVPDGVGDNYVAAHVRSSELSDVGIDAQSPTTLQVLLHVDADYPDAPMVDRMNSWCNAVGRLRFAIQLLSHENCFSVQPPIIPLFFTEPSTTTFTDEQNSWLLAYGDLQAKYSGDIFQGRGQEGNVLVAQQDAVTAFNKLLSSGQTVWGGSSLVHSWDDILLAGSQVKRVTSPFDGSSSSPVPGSPFESSRTYTLDLVTATPEAAFAVGCALTGLSLLRRTPAFAALCDMVGRALRGEGRGGSTSSTDESDDDGSGTAWRRVSNGRRAREDPRRRARHELSKLGQKPAIRVLEKHTSLVTSRLLLALCSSINIRRAPQPYLCYLIDNLWTAGCMIDEPLADNLGDDVAFLTLSKALPELRVRQDQVKWKPTGWWNARLYVPATADMQDIVADLNPRLRTAMRKPDIQLSVRQFMAPRGKTGRVLFESKCLVSLTPGVLPRPPTSQRRVSPRPASASSSPHSPLVGQAGFPPAVPVPILRPYQAAQQAGLKRLAAAGALDHRPHKTQQLALAGSKSYAAAVSAQQQHAPVGKPQPSSPSKQPTVQALGRPIEKHGAPGPQSLAGPSHEAKAGETQSMVIEKPQQKQRAGRTARFDALEARLQSLVEGHEQDKQDKQTLMQQFQALMQQTQTLIQQNQALGQEMQQLRLHQAQGQDCAPDGLAPAPITPALAPVPLAVLIDQVAHHNAIFSQIVPRLDALDGLLRLVPAIEEMARQQQQKKQRQQLQQPSPPCNAPTLAQVAVAGHPPSRPSPLLLGQQSAHGSSGSPPAPSASLSRSVSARVDPAHNGSVGSNA